MGLDTPNMPTSVDREGRLRPNSDGRQILNQICSATMVLPVHATHFAKHCTTASILRDI